MAWVAPKTPMIKSGCRLSHMTLEEESEGRGGMTALDGH